VFVKGEKLDDGDLKGHGLSVVFYGEAENVEDGVFDILGFHVLFAFHDMIGRASDAT